MHPQPTDILVAHTYYREPGGEDVVFEAETALLERHGHRVTRLIKRNDELTESGAVDKLRLAASSAWSAEAAREVARALRASGARVAHFHNTLPQLPPSVYRACRRAGVPVVQTLHNYRPGCLNGLFFRDGRPCQDCVGHRVPWPGVAHACYRASRTQSAAVAAAATMAKSRQQDVALYLALTSFARDRFIEVGLPADKIVVKPNFVAPDPGPRAAGEAGDCFLYVGRLTPEKGLLTLLRAAARLPDVPFQIVGDGPLRPDLERIIAEESLSNVALAGLRPKAEVLDLMRTSRALVMPSEWYETFGLVLIEAYACAVPAVASRIGALGELVEDGVTGLQFAPGDATELTRCLRQLWDDPSAAMAMGRDARSRYERDFSPERAYELLLSAYGRALEG